MLCMVGDDEAAWEGDPIDPGCSSRECIQYKLLSCELRLLHPAAHIMLSSNSRQGIQFEIYSSFFSDI